VRRFSTDYDDNIFAQIAAWPSSPTTTYLYARGSQSLVQLAVDPETGRRALSAGAPGIIGQ
jgi:hypothetical protein